MTDQPIDVEEVPDTPRPGPSPGGLMASLLRDATSGRLPQRSTPPATQTAADPLIGLIDLVNRLQDRIDWLTDSRISELARRIHEAEK